MKQRYMVLDIRWCHDCNNCFMGCKDEHVGNNWEGYTLEQPRHGHRWMNIYRRERGTYPRSDIRFLPLTCQHCENCACKAAFPDQVTTREDGIVMIDYEKAKGNRAMVDACPYGAVWYNEELDMPQKCTMCAHLLDDPDWTPGVPRCTHNCPTGCQNHYYLEPEEMAKMVEEQGLEVYKPELGTNPHVYFKGLHWWTKEFITAQIRVNDDCFEGAKITVKNEAGDVVAEETTNFFGEFRAQAMDNGKYTVVIEANGQTKEVATEVAGNSPDLGVINF